MSKGISDSFSLLEQPISKFEQDINRTEGISMSSAADQDIYGNSGPQPNAQVRDIEEELLEEEKAIKKRQRPGGKADVDEAFEEIKGTGGEDELMKKMNESQKSGKDGNYGKKHNVRVLSPTRSDMFASTGKEGKPDDSTYYVKFLCLFFLENNGSAKGSK